MRGCLGWLCFLAAALACAAPRTAVAATELDRVVQAVCSKDVVLLGEDGSHGGAATIAVKARLVRRLVSQCGFGGVVFESQFYDMLDVQRGFASGTATRQQLAESIGALWSRYPEFAPLLDALTAEAKAGRLLVAGMDPQVGGIDAHYSQERLPGVLVSVLKGGRRAACAQVIGRHNRWEYDDAHPFDAAALAALRGCSRDIGRALDARGRDVSPDLRAMAESYATYLTFADSGDFGQRDRAMYQNLQRIRTRWPRGKRLLVWCANAHAAKSLEAVHPGTRSLGSYVHAAFGDRAAAIGVSALGGAYGSPGGHGASHPLAQAAPGSLEARAFTGHAGGTLRYLGFNQLRAMGRVTGRALDYGHASRLDWSTVLDGVIVLRQEMPAMAAP
jgi:erythromycin esterase-like protein